MEELIFCTPVMICKQPQKCYFEGRIRIENAMISELKVMRASIQLTVNNFISCSALNFHTNLEIG